MKKKKHSSIKLISSDFPYFSDDPETEEMNRVHREKLAALIQRTEKLIEGDYQAVINRISMWITNKYGVIVKSEDFAKWFYDKLKINKNGIEVRPVNEEDIIDCTLEYLRRLEKIAQEKGNSSIKIRDSFRWNGTEKSLHKLRELLIENHFVSGITSITDFNMAFGIDPLIDHVKIVWIKHNTRKKNDINKKSIYDLVDKLSSSGFIEDISKLSQALVFRKIENTFCNAHGMPIKMTSANIPRLFPSEFINEITEIVSSLN